MKKRPLWPLLPPVAVAAMAGVMLWIIGLMSSPGTECGLRKLTGLHCPGCGGTRCARDVLRGDLLSALSHNAMLLTGLVIFLLGSGFLIVRMTILGKSAPRIPDIRPSWLWAVLGAVVAFTILRNIPTWPFHLLAP